MAGGFLHNPALSAYLESTKRRYDRWFELALPIPHLTILTSRKQIRQCWRTPQPSWLSGWYRNNSIYVLDRRLLKRNKEQWYKLIAHEMAHVYINRFTDGRAPRWVNEGLACYLAKQAQACPPEVVHAFFHQKNKRHPDVYRVGYTLIARLIRKYGQKKFLRFLHDLERRPRTEWRYSFKRVYHIEWETFIS